MSGAIDESGQEQTDRQLRGLQAVERIREALEDRFEAQVREHLIAGEEFPEDRLHDYLTGVSDAHEPRVRLLFELHDAGVLDRGGLLADVPATCFFLGDHVRYQRPLTDWLALLEPAQSWSQVVGKVDEIDLWSAGDLIWSVSAERARDAAAYLTLLLDRPVGLWWAHLEGDDLAYLPVCAIDRWSGRDDLRVVIPPWALPAGWAGNTYALGKMRQIESADPLPLGEALAPRPRIVDTP